ncbi:5-carboxymethyl-2-hydroxymuconate isomerase [Pseudomonas qingdaonensis]|nr:5-carboxymethyl-2-hydroxymuconate isomerase [Pseudomonas qingdaonensis]
MPHLHLEYSANLRELEVDKVLLRLNHALVGSGQFAQELDIKSRARALRTFSCGRGPGRAGICLCAAVAAQRPLPEVKKQLSGSLLEVLKDAVVEVSGRELQLSVELVDMDRDSYAKVLLPA